MATKTWTGGNWSNTANWGGSLPTASDDVVITTGTWTGTVDVSTAVCRSIDFTNGSNATTLTFNASSKISIGTSTANGTNFAFKFPSNGGKGTITDNGGNISFVQTITSAAQTVSSSYTLPSLTVLCASTATVQFSSSITCNGLVVSTGILNTNGQSVSTKTFVSNNTNTRTVTLGASTITITGSGTAWDFTTTTNLTFNTNTSTIDFTYTTDSTAVIMQSGGKTFSTIVSDALVLKIAGAPIIGILTLDGVTSQSQILQLAGNVTITSTFNVTGAATSRIQVISDTLGTARTINLGTASVQASFSPTLAIFQDIVFANVKNPGTKFSGTNTGDAGGNSGDMTFSPSVTQYWVGGTGNWSDSQNHFSVSSGGVAGGFVRIPMPQDSIFIDSNSGFGSGGTITINIPDGWLSAIDTSGLSSGSVTLTDNFATSQGWNITGNLVWNPLVTVSPSLEINTYGRGTQTWTNAGSVMSSLAFLQMFNFGGTLRFVDDLNCAAYTTVFNGTMDFSTNSCNVTMTGIIDSGSATKAVQFASGKTLTLTGVGGGIFVNILNITQSGTTLTTNSVNIVVATNSSSNRTMNLAAKTWGNITLSGLGSGTFKISGGGTCSILSLSGTIGAFQIINGTTITVSDFEAWGSSGNLIVITSDSAGNAFTISKSSGIVVCDWISLKDSTISGGLSKAYAGGNSTNVSGTTGWTFTKQPFVNPSNPEAGVPQTFVVRQARNRASYW